MDFSNATDFPAKLTAGSTGDREMVYIIACKVTYLLDRGRLVPAPAAENWPVFDLPFAFDGVVLGPELDCRKRDIDVLIFGPAMALGGEPTRQMNVELECGQFRHRAAVFGDRVWTKSPGGLGPSEPEPFLEMAMTNDRAYGGRPKINGLEMGHPVNPEGRGFYFSEGEAEGNPLPNLERPDALIRTWEDRPHPACFFKPGGSMLVKLDEEPDPDALASSMLETGFNQTVPDLIVRAADLGPVLRLQGFSPAGEQRFPTPRLTGPTAYVSAGSLRGRFPSSISTLVILAREEVLIVTYLCAFRYLMRPHEKRRVELRWSGDVEVPLVA
jgi:hypothetical protein